jgi:pimeloyl-ACP methyl ester carboxylesterase
MASFVLVHGSGQNATCWREVARALGSRGHAAATPDLPKDAADWGLADHASEIARAIRDPDDVIVAHSFSGAFLPLVPKIRRCRLLVFLAAVIPEPGKSVRQQFTEDPAMFSPDWISAGPRWFDRSKTDDLAREFLFHDCDAAMLDWALGSVEFMNTASLVTEPSPFTEWPLVRTASIIATRDRTLSPAWIRRASHGRLGTQAVEIDAGHCPHVSRPVEIAGILDALSQPDPRRR